MDNDLDMTGEEDKLVSLGTDVFSRERSVGQNMDENNNRLNENDQARASTDTSELQKVAETNENNSYAPETVYNLQSDFNEEGTQAGIFQDERHDRTFALHKVVVPPDYKYNPIEQHVPNDPPAKSYSFQLDPFQATAMACIERCESVLVSAHTSAGKTVIAEYAVAQSLKNKQRVVYTSPIKSLSNQKYRELLSEFGDVGLLTGDVSINPSASCLVMTTEILRSMLYRNSELMHEVAWVIFDEIHYMQDKDRGVVWEETLILLPNAVRYVFLSATLPNAMQFARWIASIHCQPCHVVYTDYRPTPLQHFIYPHGADGIYMVVDEKNRFKDESFAKVLEVLQSTVESHENRQSRKKGKRTTSLQRIISMVITNHYDPLIVFCFSKKECEANVFQLNKVDLNGDEKKDLINEIIDSALLQLNKEDREIPQFNHMRSFLLRGIGFHHSGLLPIMKEIVEILFQEGLVRILFATETFAIGLNMPARTVLFTNAQKFSGTNFRWLTSGEYMQMSGRAGRRGIDPKGLSIVMVDQSIDEQTARALMNGQPASLYSAFHLSYNMILSLMRIEGISPEDLLRKSFYQFQKMESLPVLAHKLDKYKVKEKSIEVKDEQSLRRFHDLKLQLERYGRDIKHIITEPENCLPYLQPGRLAQVKIHDTLFPWGIIVNSTKRMDSSTPKVDPQDMYIIDILLPLSSKSTSNSNLRSTQLFAPLPNEKPVYEVIAVFLSVIENFSSLRVLLPKDLSSHESRRSTYQNVLEIQKKLNDEMPLLDPVEHMNIKETALKLHVRKVEILEPKFLESPYYKDPSFRSEYHKYTEKLDLKNRIKDLSSKIGTTESIIHLKELKSRQRTLRRLGFITADNVIDIKGRVACEISTGDELLITEMIFQGIFNSLPPDLFAATLSCFVYQEKSDVSTLNLKEPYSATYKTILDIAKRIVTVSVESRLDIDEDEYVHQFKPDMMEAVSRWINGGTFLEICEMTRLYEGSIVRTFRRLSELLKQFRNAASVLGNYELQEKSAQTEQLLYRDIISSSSLYF
ncbi:TRAMP complex ATP-dependent RNA helicase [Schizosaccharomyces cryophilus OY26]|uniref:TRAMP complex ATP-dependent RNA helicase n=1 Tax=Schizosaccharomyces cryophilus (strain OY26 / ATCC MYA-4695 / CBS 11777 / NBRC 106824 / NRRL Y48691) TaxID=653667 RepID=S9VV78_SCHCR|nr:TRAMP complex ATP-dependent RNA helicase [Schizosaccharomyces cryophilus OY26]EPY51688.1 TRAMP complex ATP-dependent RNA helicase [Schizosaccharomyces cryophilus OY26]